MNRRISTALALILASWLPGCDSYFERRDLEREQQTLQTQKVDLQQAIQKETGGKTQLTDAEKARVGPLSIELRRVDNRLEQIAYRLRELN